jgi:hypothetical protein
MDIGKTLIAAIMAVFLVCPAFAEDWGPMQEVHWHNPPYFNYPGIFNPTFSSQESLLYFDDYFRLLNMEEGKIYISKMDSFSRDAWYWSDPIIAPPPLNIDGFASATPVLSQSGDSLFFSSNRPGTRGGMDIWITVKEDNSWSDPINMGDSINSTLNEGRCSYSPVLRTLFFERNGQINISILKSELINGTWQCPTFLPEIINVPIFDTYGPYFDDTDNCLYYTNERSTEHINNIKKSSYINSEWSAPLSLTDNVNGFWYPNYCMTVTTENPYISNDRQFIFYSKQIWEVSYCIDMYSYIFFSSRTTGIEESDNKGVNNDSNISIFPNPSNGSFNIMLGEGNFAGKLKIFDIAGRLINQFSIDEASLQWNCTDFERRRVASGVYFVLIESGNRKISKKMMLLK